MLAMFISVLPILVTTICLLCKRGTMRSLFAGIIVGLAIFCLINGLSINTIVTVQNVFYTTFIDNATVLLSILLLFFLVYLLTYSNAISIITALTEGHINTKAKVIATLLFLGIILSLDDYLLCMAIGLILTGAAQRQGFSKEKTTYLINIIAVSCCCLSPFSSWMPVIKNTLIISGINETAIYNILSYNFTAYLGITIVVIVGLLKPMAFNSVPSHIIKVQNNAAYKKMNKATPKIASICFILSILIGSLLFMTFIYPCSNAVIKSAMLSILLAIPLFSITGVLSKKQFAPCIKKTIESAWELSTLLFSIWLLTNICNQLLNMGENIALCTNSTNFPAIFLPVVIYIFSGLFAFFTGSAYGTFGLFIPLAIQLTNHVPIDNIQIISVAAAISGSLTAASSLTSDTLQITADNTGGKIEYLRLAQLPYGLSIYFVSIISFLLAGILALYERFSILIIYVSSFVYLCLCHFVIAPSMCTLCDKILSFALIYIILDILCYFTIGKRANLSRQYTFHSRFIETEKLIQAKIKKILISSVSMQYQSYPLKMPGL